nr:MAG TPA: hypothetical protein [Caudoviricetes sp.]
MQKSQIIPIVRANEILIARLLDAGILYISESTDVLTNRIKVVDGNVLIATNM